MKVKFEKIRPDRDSSFRILVNPKMNESFYWHYHPEFEIIFITGDGTRHIGEHISRYEGSDLAFISPNTPHLNFDYGIRSDYEKIVVQMDKDFLSESLQKMPELADINRLFDKTRGAVLFHGEIKKIIGEKLKKLVHLTHFRQLMELLEICQLMATSAESEILDVLPIQEGYNLKEQQRIKQIYHFVAENYQRQIDMQDVVSLTNLSHATFCRYFKKMTNMTFSNFLNQYRINQSKKLLLQDRNVTEACYESGFENLSYFNKSFKKLTGENPMQFKKRHLR